MTTEKDKGINKRLTLEITEVSEPKDISKDNRPFMMLEFKAKAEGDDKPHTYKAFSSKLFEHIQTGTSIDCDINITTKIVEGQDGEPRTYTNRKVTQIYVDGQPVNVRQSGGGHYGKPLEATLAEIDSRFRDTALMQAIEFSKYTEGVTIDEDFILGTADRFYGWLSSGNTMISGAPLTVQVKAPKALHPSPAPRQIVSKPQADASDLRSLEIKNLGDLFSACLKYFKLSQSATLKELGGITKEQISDPKESWLQIVVNHQSPEGETK